MKRIPKPFTVEIRSSGRKKSPALNTPIRRAQATSPAKAAFVPDEEAPKPWKTARILPALEPSEPPASQTFDASADPLPLDQEHSTQQWSEDVTATEPDEIAFDLFLEDDEITPNVTSVTRAIPQRVSKPRLSRQAFGRAERWKHRLPKVILRQAGKPAH